VRACAHVCELTCMGLPKSVSYIKLFQPIRHLICCLTNGSSSLQIIDAEQEFSYILSYSLFKFWFQIFYDKQTGNCNQ